RNSVPAILGLSPALLPLSPVFMAPSSGPVLTGAASALPVLPFAIGALLLGGYLYLKVEEAQRDVVNSPWLQMKYGGASDFELRSFQHISEKYGEEAGQKYFKDWRTQGPPPTGPKYARYVDPKTGYDNKLNEQVYRQEWDEYETGNVTDFDQWWAVEV